MQAYSDPKRASDPYALPDVEVWSHVCKLEPSAATGELECPVLDDCGACPGTGWYWWTCFPGCLPDGDPNGPFDSEALAMADARDGMDDDEAGALS